MRLPRSLLELSYLRLWREVWDYADGCRRDIVFYHLLYVVAMAFDLAVPWLFGRLVNTLQKAGPALFHDCAVTLVWIILCHFFMWLFHGPGRVIERRAGQQVYVTYTMRMFRRLNELPLSWHQDHHSGSTINRIRTAATALKGFVENSFVSFQRVISLAGSIVMLTGFSPVIGLVSLTGSALSLLTIVAMNRRITEAVHESNEATHVASAVFYDFVSNIVSIVILRLQKFSQATLLAKLNLVMPPFMREVRINEWRYFVGTMFSIAIMSAILLGYIWAQARAGAAVAAGSLVTIYMYQEKVGGQMFDFIWMHGTWLNALTDLKATRAILADHARLAAAKSEAPAGDWRELGIENLSFDYGPGSGRETAALSDLRLTLRRGEKIALVGASGGGKTTLLSLLRALHAPQHAEVRLDDKPAAFGVLADMTTLIPQDPEIFENTIRFNVSFGFEAPDTDVYRALRLAEFMPVLDQLPQGLDTDIREKGVNLSVGQKQRLALARGIFAAEQSDIVLLDEPTSSVDLPTEEKIFHNLFAHFRGKTLIATLHRLHLLPEFDRILYLERGRLTVDLPAQDALSRPGPVRDLYLTYQRKEA